jgi:small conductance mechanosensitive channel
MDKKTVYQNFIQEVYDWLLHYGPRIVLAIVIFFVGQWIIRIASKAMKNICKARKLHASLVPFVINVIRLSMQIGLFLLIMQILGVQMTLFAALLGAAGVAIGLALSGTLQNFTGGVLIIVLRPFRVGDNIKTQNEEGTVMQIRLFYTVIRTFTNTTLIVPNSKLSNEVIFNLTREQKRRLDLSVKFENSIDFKKIRPIILKTINGCDDCLKEPPSRVGIERIEMDCYTVVINIWVTSHGYQDTKFAINQLLMENLEEVLLKKAKS